MNTVQIILAVLAVAGSIFGSAGFWSYRQTKYLQKVQSQQNESAEQTLIKTGVLALIHRELRLLCKQILDQKYVTPGQFEDLQYMADPYIKLGGDGTVEKMLKEIEHLPTRDV